MCVSHFPRFSVFTPYSTFLQCPFLNFHVIQYSCHIPSPTLNISHYRHILKCEFLIFSVFHIFRHIPGTALSNSHFPRFSVFLAIFQAKQCLCLILHFFEFSSHNPCLKCVFLIFRVFHSCSPYSRYYSVCFSFSMFFSFLAIFHILQCVLHIFHDFHF